MKDTRGNRKLVILTDYVRRDLLGEELLKDADIYAMTPGAMFSCEENGIPCITNEDFYACSQFHSDAGTLQAATEGLFADLDKQYGHYSRFPRAYTANIYWFLILFIDMLYVSKVSENMKQLYGDFIIVGRKEWDGPLKMNILVSPNGFMPRFVGLENKVRMLSQCLSGRYRWIDGARGELSAGYISWRLFCYRLKQIRKKAVSIMSAGFSARNGRARTLFVIQDGYEVASLKRHLRGHKFISVSRELAADAGKSSGAGVKAMGDGHKLAAFSKRFFPVFEQYVAELFDIYRRDIVERISHFDFSIRAMIEKYKPSAFLYSIGSSRAYEDLYAHVASENNIPVFYFQHGGSVQAFHKCPHQKYCEHNEHIRKIQIYHSKIEHAICADELGLPGGVTCGSMKFFDIYKKAKIAPLKSRTILFGPTVFNFNAWKKLLYNVPDGEMYIVHKDILGVTAELSLRLDVKVHPGQDDYQNAHFNRLIKRYGKDARIVRKIPAEEIFGDYGMLIIDNIDTMLIQIAFLYPIPIILYFKDCSILNARTRADLESRCYFVSDRDGLRRCLEQYKEGALPSKYSPDMIDKYVFPVGGEEPAARIASCIAKEEGVLR
ncbi:MAG: hypothetical protein JXB40_00105 [Candidatus Omnitrophica bacterium]|nr:hypothetical protein [Candidatus Omnitrophota bacterium]